MFTLTATAYKSGEVAKAADKGIVAPVIRRKTMDHHQAD